MSSNVKATKCQSIQNLCIFAFSQWTAESFCSFRGTSARHFGALFQPFAGNTKTLRHYTHTHSHTHTCTVRVSMYQTSFCYQLPFHVWQNRSKLFIAFVQKSPCFCFQITFRCNVFYGTLSILALFLMQFQFSLFYFCFVSYIIFMLVFMLGVVVNTQLCR